MATTSTLDLATGLGIEAVERRLVPDALTRLAIRRLCASRLNSARLAAAGGEEEAFLESLTRGPIAVATEAANEQHYEVPAEFYASVLGPWRKYSCCYWPEPTTSLADAEMSALEQTCEHAQLADGQSVLELGCGWGSLSLWMAEHYPQSQITAMSNSHSQRLYIQQQAVARGLSNLHVLTADINTFAPSAAVSYDRIVSVEMFEHLRNYTRLFEQIADWLAPSGRMLAHVFCNRDHAYPFESAGKADWMARNFFTGGIMPSAKLFHRFDRHLHVEQQWTWSGEHYRRTAEAWLAHLDANREAALDCLRSVYGANADRWLQRWRMFFLAVAELFGYRWGDEWFVTHLLMAPNANPSNYHST